MKEENTYPNVPKKPLRGRTLQAISKQASKQASKDLRPPSSDELSTLKEGKEGKQKWGAGSASIQEEHAEKEKIPIEEAVMFLKPRLHEIDKVYEWADAMGYRNTSYFSELFRNHFGKRPSEVMDRIKEEKAIELLSSQTDMICFAVAREIGKKDEHTLNKFLRRRTGKPPSYFRSEQ